MCLVSKTKFPKIALRKIKVYKVLTNFDKSPIIGYQYKIGINTPIKKVKKTSYNARKQKAIYEGYLHAWKNEDIAKVWTSKLNSKMVMYRVVEMYIPAFTRYYTGIIGHDICAKKLIW